MPTPAAHIAVPPTRIADAAPSATGRRVVAAVVAIVALGILVLAAALDPSPAGLGTHQRLGMAPCGWIVLMDTPCPTCGMTTAFAHAADGNLLASAATQPLGAVLALATAMTLLVAIFVAVTGSRVGHVFRGLWTGWTMWIVGGFALLSWGYKILTFKGLL
jgi:hypothetical protein